MLHLGPLFYIFANVMPLHHANLLIRQNEMYRFGKTKCDYFV